MENKQLVSLAKQYGTPLYVYDADKMAEQYNRLNDAFHGVNLKIKYAAKALSNISVLKWMKQQGAGLDVVSIQEAHLGIKAGYEPKDILYTPNCVSINEIIEAVDLGLMINIDNISILEQFGHKYKDSVPCCVRLNPHIMAGGNSKISTGHIDSKFGISILQMRHLLRVIDTYNINVVGLHIHTGSDILDSEVFLRGTEIIFEAAEDFPDLEFIDFGSGFKVAYRAGDVTTDIESLGKELSKRFKDFCIQRGKDLELWFEPGKFLVSESGYFLASVNVIKTTPATVFVGIDTGMNHLLRPMMYDAYHSIENISNPSSTERVYTVVGYICETDTFGTDRKLSEVRENDIIAIKNAGAYGFSMASNYNSRFRPAEVLVQNGKDYLIRKREEMDDLLKNQILVDFE
ncbi:diaminopimelate decarboxylase [Marivirga atlantica]|uniref:Diaminopimelate decarboxylase n=1 Tax=Marivirga atlantica TaxID=1548457 RepID=A0A937DI06_9BACT|nr:diaminopimelate decarboxylase [Marivirga atlantica]MBL0763656.1 diaminopimelate decarboxylase [Marivirga atlantica]